MSNEAPGTPGANGGASPAGTPPPDGGAPNTPPPPDGAVKYAKHEEIVEWRKETRSDFKKIMDRLDAADAAKQPKPGTPATPTPATPQEATPSNNEVADLRRELALKDAITDAGLGANRKQIERLFKA